MCFHDVVDEVTGLEAPQASHAAALVAFGASLASATRRPRLLVHCQLGLSRSAAAAMLLVARASARLSAVAVAVAVAVAQVVHSARPEAWPNLRLVALGDALLGRQGTLVLAAQGLLARQARRSPMLAKFMEHDGLGREALPGGVLRPPPPATALAERHASRGGSLASALTILATGTYRGVAMGDVRGYPTQAFAEALAAAAHRFDDGCAPSWAATFESNRLFRTVKALAGAAGMGDAALYVVMDDGGSLGAAYSLGKGSYVSTAITVEEGFPLHGLPPHGDVVLVRFKGRDPSATIEVLRLKDGLRHGYEAGSPGYVKVVGGVLRAATTWRART